MPLTFFSKTLRSVGCCFEITSPWFEGCGSRQPACCSDAGTALPPCRVGLYLLGCMGEGCFGGA